MPLKAVIDSLDDLSDDVKALYQPADPTKTPAMAGKFVLDVEPVGGFALENIEGLTHALATTKDDLGKKVAALDGFKGLKADAVRSQLRELERLKAFDPENEADKLAKARMTSAMTEIEQKHAAEMAAEKAEGDRLWGALNSVMVANVAKDAVIKHGGSPALLMPHIKARTKVDRESLAVIVLRDDGTPDYKFADGNTTPAGIEDLVLKLKADKDFGRAFEANASGSGAKGSTGGGVGGGPNPWVKASFNLTEQMKIQKADPAKAAHLKALAGVA